MNRIPYAVRIAAAALGMLAGVAVTPLTLTSAQGGKPTYDPTVGHAPVWETPIPAPPLSQGQRTMWPNQPDHATHWSVKDIRQAHDRLAAQEIAGKEPDPKSVLHDFPYWTRTHSMFVYHASQKRSANSAQQHQGYSQFVVIMGGTGTLQAGGRIVNARVLAESGRQIPGEMRGDTIEGGTNYQLAEGDIVAIPPDTPAKFTATSRGGMTYMVMKVNAMLYPWDLIR
ncbi:MAG: hypothetical protein DMF89_11350 [Acidobacteria bacterium]|nr:MAG: hypothetical protein DMF90_11515 [Acidobacteriota bacterium]PYR49779.1 MAG: hypothetical protein DMF89_11350 [Acidobacteriota bacterium]